MRISLLIALSAAACSRPASGQATESLGSLSGPITFRDAPHDPDGSHRDPASPAPRDGTVTLTLTAFAGVEDACPDAQAGTVRAGYRGSFASDDSGRYRAALYPTGVTTLAGCAVHRPDVHGVASTTVTAEIAVTPGACARFCGSSGRADAIARCATTPDPAACAGPVAGGAAGACEARCATAGFIGGTGSVQDGTMQAYDGDDLELGKLGDVTAPIVLDRLLDANHRPL
jgi:hypothetical protein|nr:hypothetical protein [Kofleriaceae bacterium]